MDKQRIYISTIAADAFETARQYGLGIEIAEFCTAWNMEQPQMESEVAEKLDGISVKLLHAPFNELFPCAIDPKARELAAYRYRQAIALAQRYSAAKVIVHGGYHPRIYYPVWYVAESITFWREFLQDAPNLPIVLENVLEEKPEWAVEIIEGVNDPRLRLCLDVGHGNAYSDVPIEAWLEAWAPYLSHFHIHNNDGTLDSHSALHCGSLPMKALLERAKAMCPNATMTLEVTQAKPSVLWLLENDIL